MAQLSIRSEAHANRSSTREIAQHVNDPRSLTITASQSLEDTVARLQTLHAGDIDSRVRTRVRVDPVDADRVDFEVRHYQGRWDHSVMRGAMERRGMQTLVISQVERSAQAMWLVAAGIGMLFLLLLLIQINTPMLLMFGMLPLLVLRDNLTERRGAARLTQMVHRTLES